MPRPSLPRKCKAKPATLLTTRISKGRRRGCRPAVPLSNNSSVTPTVIDNTSMADGADPSSHSTAAQDGPSILQPTEATDQPAVDSTDDGGGKPKKYDRVRELGMRIGDLVSIGSLEAAYAVTELMGRLSKGVDSLAECLAMHVTWDTLSPATQAELTAWAPRAKDYMEDDWKTAGCK